MADQTKACNLTEDEINQLINWHGYVGLTDNRIERVNYLNKRLKTFKEIELTEVKSSNTAAGWGNSNG